MAIRIRGIKSFKKAFKFKIGETNKKMEIIIKSLEENPNTFAVWDSSFGFETFILPFTNHPIPKKPPISFTANGMAPSALAAIKDFAIQDDPASLLKASIIAPTTPPRPQTESPIV